jgi:UDP-N-acetylglucosamine transferase subunit ALG13
VTHVVASVGTDHHQFSRLLDWLSQAQLRLDVDVFVQRGATPARVDVPSIDFLPSHELDELLRGADTVVCHGGPGSISAARRFGHRPIVVPRDPLLGEIVDDHQIRYAARLAAADLIDVATSSDQLIRLLAEPRISTGYSLDQSAVDAAVARFAELADRLIDSGLPKRRLHQRLLVRRTS